MAQRRMFSLQIVDSDAFLEMPISTQLLYFHLSMRADDDGFVDSPKKIMKIIGASDDDLKILFAKRFILAFESGIVVIKHWKIHNYIAKDRYTETKYVEEKKLLFLKDNGSYTDCIQNVDTGKVRLGKVRLGKVSIDAPQKLENKIDYLNNIPEQDINEFKEKYNCTEKQIKLKGDSLYSYCISKGRNYKNYKAFLRGALSKDFGFKTKQFLPKL